MEVYNFIKSQLDLPERAIQNTMKLLAEDATIPFIARYRKEQTGNLDEVQIGQIADLLKSFQELEKRKAAIRKALGEQEVLTPELDQKIEAETSMALLEDLYLPYKKKRKTKADTARNAGLEPLAKMIMAQNSPDPEQNAKRFLNAEIRTIEEALEGAKNIIAEWINENRVVRSKLRRLYARKAIISSKVIKAEKEKAEAQKFQQYFEWDEALRRIPSHRFLAIHRAEKEGFLRMKVEVEKEEAIESNT